MDIFNADAVAAWIAVFFALATVTAVLVVTALVALFVSARSAAAPAVQRKTSRVPDLTLGRPTTHGAA